MGHRGNVYVTSTGDPTTHGDSVGLYVYTHWSGHDQPARAQAAVKFACGRWNDQQYCMKIIVDQLLTDTRDGTSGAGLSFSIGDNSYPIVCVDVADQVVGFATPGSERDRRSWYHVVSFRELADAPAFEGYPVKGQPAPWAQAKNAARIAELEAELARLRGH